MAIRVFEGADAESIDELDVQGILAFAASAAVLSGKAWRSTEIDSIEPP